MNHFKNIAIWSIHALVLSFFTSCHYMEKLTEVEKKAQHINHYETVALHLMRENKELEREANILKYEIENLKTQNLYLKGQLDEHIEKKSDTKRVYREIASVKRSNLSKPKKDIVEFEIYKWGALELLQMAQKEFNAKNFEKASQYYMAFSKHYPTHELHNDDFLFQAGLATYETKKYNDWAHFYFSELIEKYPSSAHYRGAKLWEALISLGEGDAKKFFNTVEEFRLKYRNTPEWKTLSAKYEEINKRYKN